ncbi:MAG: carbohydrate ABC transporter permease [Nitrososphaeria archaeon]
MNINILRLLKIVFLIISIIIFVFPCYYMIVVSLSKKTSIEAGAVIPDFYFGNFMSMTVSPWADTIINSLITTISCVILTIFITFPAAYAFSRLKFTADKHLFFWFLTNRMAPPVAMVLPYLIIWRSLGIWDTTYGLILAYFVFNIPVGVWLFSSFMGNIPKEIDEQAFIDGFSLWQYFRKIFIPASLPSIGVVAFFIWLFTWSEMFFASVLTSFNSKTINAQLFVTLGRVGYGVQYDLASAAGVITIIPGLILLYWARTYLAKGFTFGRL